MQSSSKRQMAQLSPENRTCVGHFFCFFLFRFSCFPVWPRQFFFFVFLVLRFFQRSPMFGVSKRKRDASEVECKKAKAQVGEKERELISLSGEWPIYNHPNGGTVKITPWGSLRQYVDLQTGEQVTRFEDVTFNDLSFASSATNSDNQIYELPQTPMSLNGLNSARSSPAIGDMRFSPSNEAEQYVVEGYRRGEAAEQLLFGPEQENYFGMMESEELSDVNNDSMVM